MINRDPSAEYLFICMLVNSAAIRASVHTQAHSQHRHTQARLPKPSWRV